MRLLTELLDALLDGLTPSAAAPPRRPGNMRYHWHLSPNRQRHYFVQRSGRWVCPFCGCA